MSRILFVMLHPGFVRYYDGALRALADAGHEVHVAFEVSRTKLGEDETARRLASVSPRLTCGTTPERAESVREFLARSDRTATRSGDGHPTADAHQPRELAWESLATTVRLLLDYLRFFEPAFAEAGKLRERAEKRLPRVYVSLVRACAGVGALRAALAAVLRTIERVIPPPHALEPFIRQHDPDVLLVTPLIELGSQQVDYVKCARRLGVRSALCVASWDNLTSKGLIRVVPDHVIVWNEVQKREAVELHGVAPDGVMVTGAQLFDRWFDARPSRSRAELCRTIGLDPERPFVLYVGSSIFIAPDEVPFAERWIARLRASADPAVSSAGVLIRPHPANSRQWHALDRGAFAGVAVWPRIGTDPNDPDFHRDFFDSLYHCAAVVGINTSAQLEAGIVGRPVFTIRDEAFAHAQAGTLHFRHLAGDAEGTAASRSGRHPEGTAASRSGRHPEGTAASRSGRQRLVQAADTLGQHVQQLAPALRGERRQSDEARRFIASFVRPRGLEQPATPVFVEAIDAILREPRPAPVPDPLWVRAARPCTVPVAALARALAEDRPLWVYAARPFAAAAVHAAALVYRVDAARRSWGHTAVKRLRRGAHRVWYESVDGARKRWRRARKPIGRAARSAGGAAKRVLGPRV